MSPYCRNCGGHVSADFARVLGDRDGNVHACVHCSENTITEAAAGLEGRKLTGGAMRV